MRPVALAQLQLRSAGKRSRRREAVTLFRGGDSGGLLPRCSSYSALGRGKGAPACDSYIFGVAAPAACCCRCAERIGARRSNSSKGAPALHLWRGGRGSSGGSLLLPDILRLQAEEREEGISNKQRGTHISVCISVPGALSEVRGHEQRERWQPSLGGNKREAWSRGGMAARATSNAACMHGAGMVKPNFKGV